jgi:hypothetical protein
LVRISLTVVFPTPGGPLMITIIEHGDPATPASSRLGRSHWGRGLATEVVGRACPAAAPQPACGVYVRDDVGMLQFHALSTPTPEHVAEVARWTYGGLARALAACYDASIK